MNPHMGMNQKTFLVVDDSAIYRSQIKRAIESENAFKVVGIAENGNEAVDKIESLKPDFVVLDLEMPVCNGLEALKKIKGKKLQTQVILFASPTKSSAEVTLEALELGARDFLTKPSYSQTSSVAESPSEKIAKALMPKVKALVGMKDSGVGRASQKVTKPGQYKEVNWKSFLPKILVIGSSTGGPTALETLFSYLQPPFTVPIVITQHMPPVFTASFADRLGKVSGISSYEASDGMILQPNHIYVAPGGLHMKLIKKERKVMTELFDGEEINFIKPAVDPLFQTASEIYKNACLGVIMTGMGQDGLNGAIKIKNDGGGILIQNKESCAVWGMPAAVFNEGCFDADLSIQGLAEKINGKISENRLKIKATA